LPNQRRVPKAPLLSHSPQLLGQFRLKPNCHLCANLVMVLNVDGLILEKPGRYEWVFMVDGTDLGRIGLKAVQRKVPTLTG
jgi:hypothetical protein